MKPVRLYNQNTLTINLSRPGTVQRQKSQEQLDAEVTLEVRKSQHNILYWQGWFMQRMLFICSHSLKNIIELLYVQFGMQWNGCKAIYKYPYYVHKNPLRFIRASWSCVTFPVGSLWLVGHSDWCHACQGVSYHSESCLSCVQEQSDLSSPCGGVLWGGVERAVLLCSTVCVGVCFVAWIEKHIMYSHICMCTCVHTVVSVVKNK